MSNQPSKQLKKEWYRKLQDSGFEDIEVQNSPHEHLKVWHCSYFQRLYSVDQYQERQRYFILAERFAHTYVFKNEYQKTVWALHSEGYSCREIAAVLGKKKTTIHYIILRIREVMDGYRRS